jgi:hypothetical protein
MPYPARGLLLFLFALTLCLDVPGRACVQLIQIIGAPNVTIVAGTPTVIRIDGYETFGASPGQFCACALKQVDAIQSIDAMIAHIGIPSADSLTVFVPNPTTSAEAAALLDGDAQGFLAQSVGTIPPGAGINVEFHVTLDPGKTAIDLANDLASGLGPERAGRRAPGGGLPIIVTDEAAASGSFMDTHQEVYPAGDVVVTGTNDPPGLRNYLSRNHPNPFNPTTIIEYSIRERGRVTLTIHDVTGRVVRTLVDEVQTPRFGYSAVTWDGRSDTGTPAASGVYFYRLVAPGFSQTYKMVLLK